MGDQEQQGAEAPDVTVEHHGEGDVNVEPQEAAERPDDDDGHGESGDGEDG